MAFFAIGVEHGGGSRCGSVGRPGSKYTIGLMFHLYMYVVVYLTFASSPDLFSSHSSSNLLPYFFEIECVQNAQYLSFICLLALKYTKSNRCLIMCDVVLAVCVVSTASDLRERVRASRCSAKLRRCGAHKVQCKNVITSCTRHRHTHTATHSVFAGGYTTRPDEGPCINLHLNMIRQVGAISKSAFSEIAPDVIPFFPISLRKPKHGRVD